MYRIEFAIEHKIDAQHIFDLLVKKYSRNEIHQACIHRQYVDSFDWRLHQKSYICGIDKNNTIKSFFLSEKKTGEGICMLSLKEVPEFSKDIAHKKCRQLLESILQFRALISVATVNICQKQLQVVNKEGKTLVRLLVESYTIPGHANSRTFPARLIVCPVRGYEKLLHDVMQYIPEQLKLSLVKTNLLDEILVIIGKSPNPKNLGVTQKLGDSLSTWEAAQILLCDLLRVMQANEQGLREAIDTEFLHIYRVAVRRTRSLLTQIKHLFSDKEVAYFKQEFYWLGLITGPTRDLDVYLLKFDDYINALPQKLWDDLVPFRKFLRLHWKIEHARLCEALDSKRYCKLIQEWKRLLKREYIQSPQAFNAKKPAKQLAYQRIMKLYKKVLKEGKAITSESPDEDLHELRKKCKKFRYLLDFFQSYYASNQIEWLVKNLKILQVHLGNFQDLCVQIQQLSDFAQQMRDEDLANTKTIMAMGVLAQNLVAQKDALRANFNKQFKEFSSRRKEWNLKWHLGIKNCWQVCQHEGHCLL